MLRGAISLPPVGISASHGPPCHRLIIRGHLQAPDCAVAQHVACAGLDDMPKSEWYCAQHTHKPSLKRKRSRTVRSSAEPHSGPTTKSTGTFQSRCHVLMQALGFIESDVDVVQAMARPSGIPARNWLWQRAATACRLRALQLASGGLQRRRNGSGDKLVAGP